MYSFKVLPHVAQIERALAEIARILKPGGGAFLEFYNPNSFATSSKDLSEPHAVSNQTNDTDVFTRYDDLNTATSYLPAELQFIKAHGIRVVTPAALLHRVPIMKSLIQWTEEIAEQSALAPLFGGLVLEVSRR